MASTHHIWACRACQGSPTLLQFPNVYAIWLFPDVRSGIPNAPALRHRHPVRTCFGVPSPGYPAPPDVPLVLPDFRPPDLTTSNFQIRIRTSRFPTRLPDPSDEPRISRSLSQHSLSSPFLPPPSPDLATVTKSDLLPLLHSRPPEPAGIRPSGCGLLLHRLMPDTIAFT
ncbi:hypothetical protein K438DRAFT_1777536 [Mycena galopus ATCC 62051]|nr:hypothetical protein K438DRAFT_1777536 [Mycena galopus ATCC 62051]